MLRSAVEDIANDGMRARRIIARIHTLLEKERPRADHININTVVGEVLELTRHELFEKRIVLQTELATGQPSFLGDRVQLQQVLLDLITNAVEAMSRVGEDRRQLTIGTSCDEPDHITVHVRDTGIGIEPIWNASSIRSLRQRPMAWESACRSAGRSSASGTGDSGLRRMLTTARRSRLLSREPRTHHKAIDGVPVPPANTDSINRF